jgi:hypothetical protein
MQHEDAMSWKHVGSIHSSPKKNFCHILVAYAKSVANRYDLRNMVSVPAEEHNNISHTSPFIPQVALMRLMLHRQRCLHYENVFMSWGSNHKTFLGPHAQTARLWLVARWTCSPYQTIETVLKQTSSWGDGSGIHNTWREYTYLLTFSSAHRYRKVNYRK